MKDFGFNDMSDEEFRKEFLKLLSMYQSGFDRYMKSNFNNRGFMSNPFFSIEPIDDNFINDILKNINKNMDIERGEDEMGEWEKRSWQSPDGSSSFNSYSRNSFYNPFEAGRSNFKEKPEEVDTLKLLEVKLNKAIMDEKYEDAAKIRDLINSLKEDNNGKDITKK
jgi:excinuclease UvrABC helicase subunit UvrB